MAKDRHSSTEMRVYICLRVKKASGTLHSRSGHGRDLEDATVSHIERKQPHGSPGLAKMLS